MSQWPVFEPSGEWQSELVELQLRRAQAHAMAAACCNAGGMLGLLHNWAKDLNG